MSQPATSGAAPLEAAVPGLARSGGTIMPEKTLYERLGGVFAIAAVIDHFSDAIIAEIPSRAVDP